MANPYGTFTPNISHSLSIRSVKILDIGYIFAASSVVGYISARLLSKVFTFDKKNYQKNIYGKIKLAFEILIEMAIIGVIVYISRQFIQELPFPFDGWMGYNAPVGFTGFKHQNLKELQNPYPIAFFIIFFQENLKNKILYFTELTEF